MLKKLALLAFAVSATFSNALAAADCSIKLSATTAVFTGEQIKPTVSKLICDDEEISASGYTVRYGTNINAGDNEGVVIVNYGGNAYEQRFTIARKGIYITIPKCEKEKGQKDPEFKWNLEEVKNVNSDTLARLEQKLPSLITLTRAEGEDIFNEDGDTIKYAIGFAEGVDALLKKELPNFKVSKKSVEDEGYMVITKKKVTISADDFSKTYGKDDPDFTYSMSRTLTKDELASIGKISIKRDGSENAGKYPINVSVANPEPTELSVTVVPGTLTIKPAAVTVTVGDVSKVYGEATPEFSYKATGLVGTDKLKDVTLSCAKCSATGLENVGKYDITASVKASSNSNYTVTTKAGTLTVTQKAATATVGKFEKNYGDKDPKFTFTTEGLVTEGEELELPSITRAKGEDVGSYKVSLSFAEGSNTNYKLTIVPGSLTINPRPVTLTVTDLTKKFGEKDPELTYTVKTLASFDGVEVGLNGVVLAREKGENAGTYPISVTVDEEANPNYVVTIAEGGSLTISPNDDAIVVSVKGKSNKVQYNGKEQVVKGYEITTNNEAYSLKYVTYSGDSVISGKDAGKYFMGLSKADFTNTSENYKSVTFDVEDGVLEITPKQVIVSAVADTITYGDAIPSEFKWTVDSLIAGDELDNIHVSLNKTGILPAGDYTLTFDQQSPSNNNYVVSSYEAAALTVNKKVVTITIDDAEKIYSEPDPAEFTYTISGLLDGDQLPGINVAREKGENVLKDSDGMDSTYRISATISSENNNPNYLMKIRQGHFTIKPYPKRITVAIFGEDVYAKYTGEEITVEKKFDVTLIPMSDEDKLPEGFSYSKDFVAYKGELTISATEMGRYPMGLSVDDFVNVSPNFEQVSFLKSVDGALVIDEFGPKTSIAKTGRVNAFGVSAMNHRIQVSGSKVGDRYAVYDMQGNVLRMGAVEASNFEIPVSNSGVYMVRVGSSAKRIRVK